MGRTALLLSCLVALGGCAGNTKPGGGETACHRIDKDQINELFNRWNRSLKGTPAEVAANYTGDAVLLPTVSDEPHVGTERITKYFVAFLKKHPQGTIDKDHRWTHSGCDVAEDAGLYTFDTDDGQVLARYSYVYHYVGDNKWLIWHHHSSVLPETYCKLGPGIHK